MVVYSLSGLVFLEQGLVLGVKELSALRFQLLNLCLSQLYIIRYKLVFIVHFFLVQEMCKQGFTNLNTQTVANSDEKQEACTFIKTG